MNKTYRTIISLLYGTDIQIEHAEMKVQASDGTIRKKQPEKLTKEERKLLSREDFVKHMVLFHERPIQYGKPTKEDFDYLLELTEELNAIHDSGLNTENEPGDGPWLIESGIYKDFNDLQDEHDIQIGWSPTPGFIAKEDYYVPTAKFKDPIQTMWENSLMNFPGGVPIFGAQGVFDWFIDNHEGEYLAVTGAGPCTLRITLYDKE